MIVKKDGNIILDQKGINQALKRIAQEIISKHESLTNIAFIGIRTRGAFLAYRLRDEISKKAKDKLPTGVLDINLYRYDWTRIDPKLKLESTEIAFSIDDKTIILVDDVLFTG